MKKSLHKTAPRSKLALRPETIAVLTPPRLDHVVGGWTGSGPICTSPLQSFACPTSA
jgi:hypothetical protein